MNNQETIHEKGFDLYNKIKIGPKTLDDAVLNLGELKRNLCDRRYVRKHEILHALADNNIVELRNISNFFYNVSGIYQKVCNHFAFLYRYDWCIALDNHNKSVSEEKATKDFYRILNYLDNSYIRKICGDIALEVIKNGAYYAYIVPSSTGLVLQQLPINYCRSRYTVGNLPAVEFDMRFFDSFRDIGYRTKVLNLFPAEFRKGYKLYRQGKLPPDIITDTCGSWYLLDVGSTIKFNFNNTDIPIFANAIPAILDLDAAQDLDRRRQMQQLLRIIVQKLPLDKNNDLIFDVDEARDIHNNAVEMLQRAIGVDVLTTFTDVDSIDLSATANANSEDNLDRVERTVYNALGVSKNIFNTDGNMSLEKSILSDESSVRNLLLQFNMFFDRVVNALNVHRSKYNFKFYMLETTQYNYKELSKMYKEQTQLGYSKMLPQIALGHSQSFILNTAHFENEVLHLSEIMIPPLMSSTLSGEDILGKSGQSKSGNSQSNTGENTGGRPEKPDDEKSDKTIQNIESMS